MNTITQCPQCGTRFKVIPAQLETHQGMVRCGRCLSIFNAKQYLHDDEPNPQLSLPITPPHSHALQDSPLPKNSDMPQNRELPFAGAQPPNNPSVTPLPAPSPLTLTQQFSTLLIADEVPRTPLKKKGRWLWLLADSLLIIGLLAQATYFFRVELAARLPGLQPMLMSYCNVLKCSIPLPQKADQLSIESSNLEANPASANSITLNAILRNFAPYPQAYPDLELTLTDGAERVLARRLFVPADYLASGEEEKRGLLPNRDLNIKLPLDVTDLKPTGYRLFLLYPQ